MKYYKIFKALPVLASLVILLNSCDKIATTEPIGDAGQTLVKVLDGGTTAAPGYKLLNIELKSTPQVLDLVDIRRDVPNNGELNKVMNVIVKDDPGAVSAYDTSLIPLPAGSYTLDPGNPLVGTDYKLAFAPGEFAKEIKLTLLNALALSLSSRYGLGFTLSSVDANGNIIGDQKTIVVEIGVKNKWDGIYSYTSGLVTRYSAPGLPLGDALSGPLGSANPDVTMATVGANTVEVTGLTWSGGTLGVGGIAGLRLTVDPVTNLVTAASSGNGTLTTWAGHVNKYDPATKTFMVALRWNPTANVREYEVVWKYKKAR